MHRLPAAPIVALLEGMAHDRDIEYTQVAKDLGIGPRSAFAWRRGERDTISFDLADAVLVAAHLNWHDVFAAEDLAEVMA
jgi:hypothetical protein